jgi:hypothetical protein
MYHWNILLCYLEYKWKMHIIFFITELHTSDSQDSGPVTRKPYGTGPLNKTNDGHSITPVTAIHVPVTGSCPSLVTEYQ